ncbi:MAG: hypothetical protein IJ533_02700 [Prevotella sp.]|nr:hypothetical protein [Prevotella sp.]
MDNNNVYLVSKPRYEILDGLRGVAAMPVVANYCRHAMGLHDDSHAHVNGHPKYEEILAGKTFHIFDMPCSVAT